MKQNALRLYDALWLPLLLILGTSWLYAPWLYHESLGRLQVISLYEAVGVSHGWLFRLGDILAALLIGLTVWRSGLLKRQRWLGQALLLIALLNIIDASFIIGCLDRCTTSNTISRYIHDGESVVNFLVIAYAAWRDWRQNKQPISGLFLLVQILSGLLAATALLGDQGLVVIQYIYEPLTIAWIAYLLRRYQVPTARPHNQSYVRLAIASALFIAGLIELTLTLHIRLRSDLPLLLEQHGVLVGTTLLYLSRQIYRGQRRAAVLVAIVLATQVIKYALLSPHVYALLLSELTLIALWLNWSSFNRNTGVPPIVSRLKNLLILLVGTAMAVLLLFTLAQATGRQRLLNYDVKHLFAASSQLNDRREDLIETHLLRFRYVGVTLGAVLLLFTAFTVFQPANDFATVQWLEPRDIERLLRRYSKSSEDYFKLWPGDKSYFTDPTIEGFIAYKKVGSTIFCLADPICSKTNRPRLLELFITACRAHGWAVSFMIVDESSRELYEQAGLKTMHIGSSAVVPIAGFNNETVRDKWWRWQMNRADKAGVSYQVSLPPHSVGLLDESSQLSNDWLQRAGHKEQGFALGHFDANYLQQCRLHTLRNADGQLVAFANQLPTYNNNHQATVDLIRFQPDFNGAMPVLIANIIARLGDDYKRFDLGFVPLAKVDSPVATIARRLATARFSAAGLEQFKGKFKPDWRPQYLAYDGDVVDVTVLLTRLETALEP